MAGDSSPPAQQSPPSSSPAPDNSSSSSSPPQDKDKSSSPPPSSPPPAPSNPSPSPPPPQQSPPPEESNNNNNNNNQNEGGESSPTSPSPSPPPQQSQSQSPPASNNNQSPAPPRSGQQSPPPPFSPPPPIGDQRNTPSSSTSTSGGTQHGVFVPPGSSNSPTTVSPARSSPRQSSSSFKDGANSSSNSSASSTSSSSSSSSSMHKLVIAGVVAGGFVLLLMLVICILCLRRKKRKAGMTPPYGWEQGLTPPGKQYWKASPQDHAVKIPATPAGGYGHTTYNDSEPNSATRVSSSMNPSPSLTLGFNKSSFTYDELAAATNGFDKANMLGQGGFGYVHKGMLPNGKEIAVKRLKSGSGQGEREFQAEVEIISRVHHRHLVSLVGYCSAAGQRMLVYEFVPNNNLEYHLHVKGDPPLSMSTRLRIALGSAKGLSYLHEDCHPRIIHRDIKASNILLDDNFEAMVADFGLAKLTTDTNTHVSTRVMGTFGYLAPEYAASGKLTEKSDVFSFGVMLLEIITGRRPVDPNMKYMEDSLVDWARPLLTKALDTGNYDELADPLLERNYNPQEMQRMVACAAACIRHSAKRRPKMSQIVRALEGDVSLEDLNDGKPGNASMYGSSDGSDYDSRQYSADLKKFRQMAFATQDFGATGEFGGNTSEYGLNPSTSSSDASREMKQ